MDNNISMNIPEANKSPIDISNLSEPVEIWHGETVFRNEKLSLKGIGEICLDFLPFPQFRFGFKPDKQPELKDLFFSCNEPNWIMECGQTIGPVKCGLLSRDTFFSGCVEDQVVVDCESPVYARAKFVVINGPIVEGESVLINEKQIRGRVTAKIGQSNLTLDRIGLEKPSRRSVYEVTHVVHCEFTEAQSIEKIDRMKDELFWTLSLMKCRWVGIVGPWLESTDSNAITIRMSVSKTTKNRGGISWCHGSIGDSFSELAPTMSAAFADSSRAEALQTALHWLIEAEQCAGGIEGAMILQQAALECLAWLGIVVDRKICSEAGFKNLPAADKIRWLLSLYQIDASIPISDMNIAAYAKEFNLKDLIDVLVDVRNALVHAEPKKVAKLFSRNRGDEERGDLWFQIGGILQQACLASIGYKGLMMMRNSDAMYATNAITQVPWGITESPPAGGERAKDQNSL
ncbi:hypothetical protein SH501x_001592 [Pirellulaceae bacterium SH501]